MRDLEERKKLFVQSIKNKNWWKLTISLLLGIVFTGYFIQVYTYHDYMKETLLEMQNVSPILLNRFYDLI